MRVWKTRFVFFKYSNCGKLSCILFVEFLYIDKSLLLYMIGITKKKKILRYCFFSWASCESDESASADRLY